MSRDLQVRVLHSAEEVSARIEALARELYRDYSGQPDGPLAMLSILEGARRFAAALCEELALLRFEPEVCEVRAHRTRGMQLEDVQIELTAPGALAALEGRDVLVVDDIADEGRTLRAILDLLERAGPRSVRVAVLVDKRAARREILSIDYAGFAVESGWVVGFGMDVDGEFRDLDEIGVVVGSEGDGAG